MTYRVGALDNPKYANMLTLPFTRIFWVILEN